MNKTISGKVVSGTGDPLPNLLVSLHAHALPEELRSSGMLWRAKAGRRVPEELLASQGAIGSSETSQRFQGESAAYVADNWQEIQSDRLGSAYTDRDGRFELAYEARESRGRGYERYTDPLLLVTTPEEPNIEPPTILHFSTGVPQNAGQTEGHVIEVPTERLEKPGVEAPGS